jgi:5-formyltetrahydrofolate cyclo-ligase
MLDPLQLRKEILTKRNKITEQEIAANSMVIQQRLLSLEEIRNHQSIFVYVSFRSEVATLTLVDALIDIGKNVIVPITRVEEKRLDAIRITNRLTDLEPGYCNIPEPKEELCKTKEVSPEEIEVILLPGSVFDERGGRFGYGGGYYDRFLAKVPTAVRIGLAFDLQIVERAPLQEHDEILDLVVTESRVIRSGR